MFASKATQRLSQVSRHLAHYSTRPAAMKLLYPNSLVLDASLLEGFSTSLHSYDVKSNIPDEHTDADILVTWSNAGSMLADAAKRMPNLRWIQSLAAGPNDVLNAGFDPKKVQITTGSGLHDHTVAEHALALLLNAARKLYEMRDYQLNSKWPQHLGGALPDRPKGSFTSLRGARITIWGFGNIAKCLTPHLTGLGSTVVGVARSQRIVNGIEVYGEDALPRLLPETDALVMILPGSDSTRHALNKERLALLPKHAWVVNVGRGTSVDEDALAEALEGDRLGGAQLDVFEKEPLPEGSRLWKTKNLFVSPHAAGGRPQGAEDLIAYNLRRFLAGQPLKNVI